MQVYWSWSDKFTPDILAKHNTARYNNQLIAHQTFFVVQFKGISVLIAKYCEVFMTISHIWLHGRFLDAAKYNDVPYTRYLVRSTCYCFFRALITYTNYFSPEILNRLDSIVVALCFVELEWWRAERQNWSQISRS
jgi:hypothetical protein